MEKLEFFFLAYSPSVKVGSQLAHNAPIRQASAIAHAVEDINFLETMYMLRFWARIITGYYYRIHAPVNLNGSAWKQKTGVKPSPKDRLTPVFDESGNDSLYIK
jgi:hypothetical protein